MGGDERPQCVWEASPALFSHEFRNKRGQRKEVWELNLNEVLLRSSCSPQLVPVDILAIVVDVPRRVRKVFYPCPRPRILRQKDEGGGCQPCPLSPTNAICMP